MPRPRLWVVALLALVAVWLFWFEYLPPVRRVHVGLDMEGYHWPLLVAALEAVRQGRFPLWDPSIYCGIPFAGNIQAALFYPPTWLLLAANLRSRHLLFDALQAWVFLHGWLAFVLCWCWLRHRRLHPLAVALGAAVFAFSGYMISQNNHVGVAAGWAWTPLAWMGIDQAVERRSWRPLWKTTAASALCFLAGYPASFTAFAIGATVYGAARSWRAGVQAAAAIAASFAVGAVQLLPALEASAAKTFDPKYVGGMREFRFFVHFAVPDWAGFQFSDPYPYLYLGAPALFGLAWLARRPDRAALAVLGASLLLMTNPYGAIASLVDRSPLLSQALSTFCFVEPAMAAAALAAALGVDAFLRRPAVGWTSGRGFAMATGAALTAWTVFRLWTWPAPEAGWKSAAAAAVMLVLFAAGLAAARPGRLWAAALLCAAVFVDYKTAGTSRVFSSRPGRLDPAFQRGRMPAVEDAAYDELRRNRHWRIAVDGMHPTDLRRFGLATPQGFDPLLPRAYRDRIERERPFHTNRLFDLQPGDAGLLDLLGVRYFVTFDGGRFPAVMPRLPDWKVVGKGESMFRVYERLHPRPPWHIEGEGDAQPVRWEAERREFRVSLPAAARFALVEQHYPGWRASIDGRPAPIERWEGAFQAVALPAGEHAVVFEYRPASVRWGALASALALVLLAAWALADRYGAKTWKY